MVAVIAEQELTKDPELIIPIVFILKLIFFFGWLEVAKAIEDPWDGKDHEDFKVTANLRLDENVNGCFDFTPSAINALPFSQIRELISRHFWSVGRSLQQERAQVITLQAKT